ncbi:MAG: hypothetical protein Ta2A_06750 [Treponemataceae bacterium]|nr:MAG: hypothetical protein Ta2A_06750 [Treponemataceae bacterium]
MSPCPKLRFSCILKTMVKAIAKLFIALNGNVKKTQIAAGFSWGLLLGLVPAGNAFWIVLFVLSLFFKHNQGSKILVLAIIKLLAPATAVALDNLGWAILHIDALQSLFTKMFNMPFVPFTKFNNTLVAGGLCAGIGLWIPVFAITVLLIPLYRNTVLPKLITSKFFVVMQNIPLVQKIRGAVEKITDLKNLHL